MFKEFKVRLIMMILSRIRHLRQFLRERDYGWSVKVLSLMQKSLVQLTIHELIESGDKFTLHVSHLPSHAVLL